MPRWDHNTGSHAQFWDIYRLRYGLLDHGRRPRYRLRLPVISLIAFYYLAVVVVVTFTGRTVGAPPLPLLVTDAILTLAGRFPVVPSSYSAALSL